MTKKNGRPNLAAFREVLNFSWHANNWSPRKMVLSPGAFSRCSYGKTMSPQHQVINVSFSWCSVLATMTEGFELVYSHLLDPVSTQHITACGARKMDEENWGHERVRVTVSLDLVNCITHCSSHFRGHLNWGVWHRWWKNGESVTRVPCSWCYIQKEEQVLTPLLDFLGFSAFLLKKKKKCLTSIW